MRRSFVANLQRLARTRRELVPITKFHVVAESDSCRRSACPFQKHNGRAGADGESGANFQILKRVDPDAETSADATSKTNFESPHTQNLLQVADVGPEKGRPRPRREKTGHFFLFNRI